MFNMVINDILKTSDSIFRKWLVAERRENFDSGLKYLHMVPLTFRKFIQLNCDVQKRYGETKVIVIFTCQYQD